MRSDAPMLMIQILGVLKGKCAVGSPCQGSMDENRMICIARNNMNIL